MLASLPALQHIFSHPFSFIFTDTGYSSVDWVFRLLLQRQCPYKAILVKKNSDIPTEKNESIILNKYQIYKRISHIKKIHSFRFNIQIHALVIIVIFKSLICDWNVESRISTRKLFINYCINTLISSSSNFTFIWTNVFRKKTS